MEIQERGYFKNRGTKKKKFNISGKFRRIMLFRDLFVLLRKSQKTFSACMYCWTFIKMRWFSPELFYSLFPFLIDYYCIDVRFSFSPPASSHNCMKKCNVSTRVLVAANRRKAVTSCPARILFFNCKSDPSPKLFAAIT